MNQRSLQEVSVVPEVVSSETGDRIRRRPEIIPAGSEHPALAFSVADLEIMADRVARSRLFPGIEDKTAAFTLMLLCQSEGLHPAQAMRRYHIIDGHPSMRADAMQAEFQRQGGTVEWVGSDSTKCEAIFSHPVQAPKGVTIVVTLEEMDRAGITKGRDGQTKKNWRQYPRQMLRARAVSEGVRMVLPGVVAGIYTPEEVQDFDPPPVRPRPIEPPPEFPSVRQIKQERQHADDGGPRGDRDFIAWLNDFLAGRNAQWADYWSGRCNGNTEDVGDLMSSFQLRGHLYKWLGQPDGKDAVHNRVTRALATAWRDDPGRIEGEALRYCRDVWARIKPRVEARLSILPAGDKIDRPEIEADTGPDDGLDPGEARETYGPGADG